LLSEIDIDSRIPDLIKAGLALSQLRDRPDAIVCVSSSVALAIIAGMKQGGMELGQDYDLVTKPMTELISLSQPGIIGIDESFLKAGQELARMVMARIAGTDPFVLQMIDAPKQS